MAGPGALVCDGPHHGPADAQGQPAADVAAYQRDGVVCLRGMIDPAWIERLRAATERVMAKPGPMGMPYGARGAEGTFFGDMYVWTFDPDIRDFALDGPGAALAGAVMGAAKINLFYDHLLIKEPGSAAPTPWHHDLPYWCVDGDQVCSVWVPMDPVDRASGAVEFIAGSHRSGTLYRAQDFRGSTLFADQALTPIPDIEADRSGHDIRRFDVAPGDCLVLHARTVHGAPGNASSDRRRRAVSLRFAGDDAVFIRRPAMSEPIRDPGLEPGQALDSDLFPVVWRAP